LACFIRNLMEHLLYAGSSTNNNMINAPLLGTMQV